MATSVEIPQLEDIAMSVYLDYLETEAAAYVSLVESQSKLLRTAGQKMMLLLKDQLNTKMRGVASTSLRQKMLQIVFSERYPSPQYCNVYQHKRTAKDVLTEQNLQNEEQNNEPGYNEWVVDVAEHLYSNCPNTCCSGNFIKETMAGIVMSPDLKELIFSSAHVMTRKSMFPGVLEFDTPAVLSHLLDSTHKQFSQLEKLVFAENFVKEEASPTNGVEDEAVARLRIALQHQHPNRVLQHLRKRQWVFGKNFGNSLSDRRGLVLNLLCMFRDISPRSPLDHDGAIGYYKLSVLVLKNNIQCEMYSNANFQFEFLARVGFCCPQLKVLDIFGTDTWADCLVAFFFRDAFHSLHRYLFFMEDENDEDSAYHPHDLGKYCQFCLDRMQPVAVERPFTVNPIIPLIDPIYDHVIKKYPKRSYCILRNCIRVSDLIESTSSTVFELLRPKLDAMEVDEAAVSATASSSNNSNSNATKSGKAVIEDSGGIGSRLRSRKHNNQERHKRHGRRESGDRASGSGKNSDDSNKKAGGDEDEEDDEVHLSKVWNAEDESVTQVMSMVKSGEQQPPAGGASVAKKKVRKTKPRATSIATRRSTRLNKRSTRKRKALDDLDRGGSVTLISHRKRVKPNAAQNPAAASKIVADAMAIQALNNRNSVIATVSFDDWQNESRKTTATTTTTTTTLLTPAASSVASACCTTSSLTLKDGQSSTASTASAAASEWVAPENPVRYREITKWPHLNDCIKTIEVLNIGGTNVLGEFIPFILLHAPKLKSLGQWINTMIYGLEILRQLKSERTFPNIQEFSYSSDRNYFCQPYIGFVPETNEYKNVRREMIRISGKVAKKLPYSIRQHISKRKQITEDVKLMTESCPNVRKLNLVLHYKMAVMDPEVLDPWLKLRDWKDLIELDLVTMKFANAKSLLRVIGAQLETLTLEVDEEQGQGSEIVFIARHCDNLKNLRILIGDKILRGEMTLHYGSHFFRKLERLTVEGSVHLHGFAFLWGHCRALKYMRIGAVVSNEATTNVLIYDVFSLLFQVNKMEFLTELHIKNLRIRTLQLGTFLLDSLPKLQRASNWILDIVGQDLISFKQKLKLLKQRQNLALDYKEW